MLCLFLIKRWGGRKKQQYDISPLSNMSKGMWKWHWNTLQLWMEEGNLICFGNALNISVIKKTLLITFWSTDKKTVQTVGKIRLQLPCSLHLIKSILEIFLFFFFFWFEVCHLNISLINCKCNMQKVKVLWISNDV